MLKASFVVAAYNAAHFLAETVESIRQQKLEDIEIVLVDDGSTDTTRRLVEYYAAKDKRVVPVYLGKNFGRSVARNVGCEKAKSDVVLISDADDVMNLERAGKTADFFNSNPGVDLAYGGFWVIDGFSRVRGEFKPEVADFDEMITEPHLHFKIAHSTMAFRKKILDRVKYSDGEWSRLGIDDWKFQVDAWRSGAKFGMIPEPPLMYYRFMPKKRDEKEIMKMKRSVL